jgi:hypothetical protein
MEQNWESKTVEKMVEQLADAMVGQKASTSAVRMVHQSDQLLAVRMGRATAGWTAAYWESTTVETMVV